MGGRTPGWNPQVVTPPHFTAIEQNPEVGAIFWKTGTNSYSWPYPIHELMTLTDPRTASKKRWPRGLVRGWSVTKRERGRCLIHWTAMLPWLSLTLESAEAIMVSHQIIRSWYTGRWWEGCYIWYSDEGTGRGRSQPRLFLAVPNVKAHPSTASVPTAILLL